MTSREKVRDAYIEQTNIPLPKLRLPDREYTLPPVKVVRDHMEGFEVRPYKPEIADCDNRAMMLLSHFSGLGYAFGWASIGVHDICTFLDENKKVWYVEPSDCKIYPVDSDLTWAVFP